MFYRNFHTIQGACCGFNSNENDKKHAKKTRQVWGTWKKCKLMSSVWLLIRERKKKQRDHSMPTRNILKTKKCPSSSILACMKEIRIRGKSHLEGDKLNMNSDEEAILTSSGKLDGKYQSKSCLK